LERKLRHNEKITSAPQETAYTTTQVHFQEDWKAESEKILAKIRQDMLWKPTAAETSRERRRKKRMQRVCQQQQQQQQKSQQSRSLEEKQGKSAEELDTEEIELKEGEYVQVLEVEGGVLRAEQGPQILSLIKGREVIWGGNVERLTTSAKIEAEMDPSKEKGDLVWEKQTGFEMYFLV